MGCGAYGKLPSAGDFIRFDLPGGFVATWDVWLQDGIIAARATLGARWTACFMSAPIWRFTLAAEVAGGHAMLGVVMPSVDRVGRQFPLTLAMPCAPAHGAVHVNADITFDQLEDIALAALDDLSLEGLKQRLAEVAAPKPVIVASPSGEMIKADQVDQLAPVLAAPHLAAACIWSARVGSGIRAMQGAALPVGATFTALFDLDAPAWSAAS